MRRLLDTVLSNLRTAAVHEAAPASDAALLRALVERNDRQALESLIRRHAEPVWRTCLRVTGSVHDAEDAFQATWCILAAKGRSIRDMRSVAAWLHRVAVRAALAARRQARARVPLTVEPPADAPSADLADELAILEEEVERLPEGYRVPIVLCYLDGKTNAEAAALLGIPEGTVYSRLARGRDRLRGRLLHRGLAPAVVAAALEMCCPAREAVSAALVQQAVRLVLSAPAGAGGVSSSATLIAKGVLQAMWWNQCRKAGIIIAALACASVVAWRLATPSAAQSPQSGVQPAVQPAAPQTDLAELHRKRVAVATKLYEAREWELTTGRATVAAFAMEAAVKLLDAERDADPKNELTALKAHHERMVKLHDIFKAKYEVKTISYSQYGAFELAVAEADVWIEQARRRAKK